VKRLLRATINSWHGLIAAARSEAAFRQELALLVVGVPLAFWLTPQAAERLALIGALLVLLVVELLNTAIEKLADRVTTEHDETIRRVKDMGSAAVGLTILLAIGVWAAVAWQRLGF
jgi:diacylglycerol kinase (ATP)